MNWEKNLRDSFEKASDKYKFIAEVREVLHELSPQAEQPIFKYLFLVRNAE